MNTSPIRSLFMSSPSSVHIAALGDVHGHMHTARALTEQCARQYGALDLIMQVGDFEPHRHAEDLRSMDAPSKYKALGDYADFHAGRVSFPAPLHFIGGNHEPYAWLEQHPDGFTLSSGIHYLGRAGVRVIGGVQVAYLSGIYHEDRFYTSRPQVTSFAHTSNKAWIAFNHIDLDLIMASASPPVDILIVHDWPEELLQPQDAHLFERRGRTLHASPGNAYARLLIELLEPRLVLCGHMHTRYHHAFEHASGRPCDVVALGHVLNHDDAIISCRYDPITKSVEINGSR
jgi:lariat debranching enzyme